MWAKLCLLISIPQIFGGLNRSKTAYLILNPPKNSTTSEIINTQSRPKCFAEVLHVRHGTHGRGFGRKRRHLAAASRAEPDPHENYCLPGRACFGLKSHCRMGDKLMNYNNQISKIVLLLGAITGFIFVLITPPFQVPDEGAHFFRAYQTATLQLKLENRDGRIGADLPRSLLSTRMLFDGFALHPDQKVDRSLYARALDLNYSENAFCSTILPYPPVAYVAQAAGIAIGKTVSPAPIVGFYFARIMNLALFLFLILCAIRLMPSMKWGMALLALMPMTLYEASSVSADAYTIGISFLMIAFLLNLATGEGTLSAREIGFMLAGTVLLALAKPGYSPLALLAFLVPRERFETGSRKFLVTGGMSIIVLMIGIFSIRTMPGLVLGPPGVDSAAQLRFILAHPFVYLAVLFRCIFRASQFGSFIGWFGWLELRLPLWIIVPYGLLLISAAFEKRPIFVNRKKYLYIAGLFVLLAAVIFTIQYLSYTPVGKRSIDSVQGRYFIPFAPLALLIFNSRSIPYPIDGNVLARRLLIGFIIFAHAISAAMLIQRYYL
jgi:uncharacterized membrane protein